MKRKNYHNIFKVTMSYINPFKKKTSCMSVKCYICYRIFSLAEKEISSSTKERTKRYLNLHIRMLPLKYILLFFASTVDYCEYEHKRKMHLDCFM